MNRFGLTFVLIKQQKLCSSPTLNIGIQLKKHHTIEVTISTIKDCITSKLTFKGLKIEE